MLVQCYAISVPSNAGCCRHTTLGFELFTQLSVLSNIPWPDSNFLFRTWHASRFPTAYTTEALSLWGFSSPLFQYHFCFQSHKPAQIYNLAISVVPLLSGSISWCLWWKLSKSAKVTQHERHCGLCYSEKCDNGLVHITPSLFAMNFPCQFTLGKRPKDGAQYFTKGKKPDNRIPNPQFSRDLK